MQSSLTETELAPLLQRLAVANEKTAGFFPGEGGERQPVHTVYGGAHLFRRDLAPRLGQLALGALETYAPNSVTLARALGLPGAETLPEALEEIAALEDALRQQPAALQKAFPAAYLAHTVRTRVAEKLKREAVEDFRIDFEDGYGNRPDDEEDRQAVTAAEECAAGMAEGTLPPFIGIRIKPFTEELKARAIRTLDIFVTTLAQRTGGRLPENFVVTQPKVTAPEQTAALVELFEILERKTGLAAGSLKLELMVETTQSIIGPDGRAALPAFVAAAGGRCRGAHFGTYDYTAACDITAAFQHMKHPACDFAKHVMKVTLAGTGVMISDGATNVMPVGPHRAPEGGQLRPEQQRENTDVVHRAWRLAYEHNRHSLENAFYQGWDLHPAQFIVRYAALYAFFLESLEQASRRLTNFIEKAAQATLVGDVFDDAATGQGLLNFFLRALSCGAITEDEVLATGLTLEEVRGKSFVKILEKRRGA